jgi:hypothetical protein
MVGWGEANEPAVAKLAASEGGHGAGQGRIARATAVEEGAGLACNFDGENGVALRSRKLLRAVPMVVVSCIILPTCSATELSSTRREGILGSARARPGHRPPFR